MTPPLSKIKLVRYKEAQFQLAVVAYFKIALPDDEVFLHPDNGGKMSPQRRIRLAHMGVLPGAPDLFLFYQGQPLAIELKTKGGSTSNAQKALHPRLEAAGVPVAICRTLGEVYDFLAPHMPLKGERPTVREL